MNEIIIIDKKTTSKNYVVKNDETLNVFVLDIEENFSNFNVNVKLQLRSQFNIIISSFCGKKFTKIYNINMDHTKNDAISQCNFFGVTNGHGELEATIKTDIKRGTTNNKSAQSIKGIMLSNDSSIHGEPKLIIDDNNVKAAHSLGVGKVNPDHLFYLQSKGLKKSEAISLLIMGFFNEVINNIEDENLRIKLNKKIKGYVS